MRIVTFLTAGTLVFTTAACAGSGPNADEGDTISRETFIQTYRQLRVEGLLSPDTEISPEERDRILGEVGVTEEELLAFVDLWGTDIEMMQGIWEEVDSLMRESRSVSQEEDVFEEDWGEDEGQGTDGSGSRRGG